MKKIISVLCVILSLALMVSVFAACGKQKPAEPAVTDDATEAPTDAVTTEPPATEAPTVARPTAEGQLVEAYDLTFYLPESLTPNEWNGMLGVYEFYTGEYSGSRPAGLDFSLSALAESNTNGDLEAYARAESAKRSGVEVEPESVEINGTTWLKFAISESETNFFAVFNNGLYELYTTRGGDTQENYDAALKMMTDTLFLAVNAD